MKLNLWNWIKKSPDSPTYSSSMKKSDKQSLEMNSDVAAEYHKYFFFYDVKYQDVPEFMIDNKYLTFKDKEIKILLDDLVLREQKQAERLKAEQEAKAAAALAAASGGAPPAKGKADPKKDVKAAPVKGVKGAVVVDDKNGPQNISVDYPQIE